MTELHVRRKATGMSQKELAAKVRISQSAMSKIESGARRPSPAVAERIARALGMDVATMWAVLYGQKPAS